MLHPFFQGLTPTVPIAHRGGAGLGPENTLAAFRQAVDLHGMRMLETDVQVSADGVLCVIHDPTLDRCTDGEGPIAAHSWAEIEKLDAGYRFTPDGGRTFPFRGQGVRVPRLDELYRAFPGLRINVELKPESGAAVALFAAAIRELRAEDRTCCGSESDEVGARLWEALPGACHFYPRDRLTQTVMALKTGGEPPADERFTVLDMPLWYGEMRLVDRALIQAAERLGKWINVWTIDDAGEMKQLAADGVGGIMTDRPDRLRAVLSA